MTMRTYTNFVCPNRHDGSKKITENDQPYSEMWERVEISGMVEVKADGQRYGTYKCATCGEPMKRVGN